MLNVYIGRANLPEGKDLIYDVEKFFGVTKLLDCDFVKSVLEKVEQGRYMSEYAFYDRFGYGMKSNCLSTGSKILICTFMYPEYVINATELGDNGISLLHECTNGSVLFTRSSIEFSSVPESGICLNGMVYKDLWELNYQISISEV